MTNLQRAAALLGTALVIGALGGCAAAVGASAVAGASAAVDRRTTGTLIDDQLVELKALDALSDDQEVWSQAHLNVTSYNGVVLLSGEAPAESIKRRAAEIVSRVPKVRLVHNEVTVAAPSTMLTRSSDTYLSGKVKSAILADGRVGAHRIKVVSENGTVFLMGLVSPTEAELATQVTRQVGGVQRVVRLFEFLE